MRSPAQKEEQQKQYESWLENQKKLTTRSSEGSLIIADKSDHFIMFHQPDLIIDQIKGLFSRKSKQIHE